MSKILIIAEHDGQSLNPSTAKTVACAAEIDGATIDVVVFAESTADIAGQAAQLDSVARVMAVEDAANTNALAAVIAPQVVALAGLLFLDGFDDPTQPVPDVRVIQQPGRADPLSADAVDFFG